MHHIRLEDSRVGANAIDHRTAWISADGSLAIDDRPVLLTVQQRTLALNYYAAALALRTQGVAVAKSGAGLGTLAVRQVVSSLAAGKPEAIAPAIDTETKKLDTGVTELCNRMETLRKTQDALSSAVPAFRPYATIDADVASDCHTR